MIISIHNTDKWENVIIIYYWYLSSAMTGEAERKFKTLYKEYIGEDLKYIDMYKKDCDIYTILNESIDTLKVHSNKLKEDLREIRKQWKDERIMKTNIRSFIDCYSNNNLTLIPVNIIKD